MTCHICEREPATDDCGDVRVCVTCLGIVRDEADRRLRLLVDALEAAAQVAS